MQRGGFINAAGLKVEENTRQDREWSPCRKRFCGTRVSPLIGLGLGSGCVWAHARLLHLSGSQNVNFSLEIHGA